MLESVIKMNEKYYPRTLLEECKYEIIGKLINDDFDSISSDESDNEESNGSDNKESIDSFANDESER